VLVFCWLVKKAQGSRGKDQGARIKVSGLAWGGEVVCWLQVKRRVNGLAFGFVALVGSSFGRLVVWSKSKFKASLAGQAPTPVAGGGAGETTK